MEDPEAHIEPWLPPPPTPLDCPEDPPPKKELLELPVFWEEKEVPQRLAGEDVVSCNKNGFVEG